MSDKKSTNGFTGRRVVVTGMGAVTCLGLGWKENWEGMKAGRSGIKKISVFDAACFPTRIAGEVTGFPFESWKTKEPALEQAGRGTFFALASADEAMADAGLSKGAGDPERFGIYFGAGDSGHDFESFAECVSQAISTDENSLVDKAHYIEFAGRLQSARRELEIQPFMTVTHLAARYGIEGPASNCLTACAASSQAIGEAFEQIRRGDADVMMTGGSHSLLHPLGLTGFSLLTALSTRNDSPQTASRPFDKTRDGFILAEGAGVLILEELSHALARGAVIYGEITGYGATSDAYRLTDMDPEGKGARRAVEIALKKASLSPADVDYISAHGTATKVNDVIETRVVKGLFGEKVPPMSSIKSMLGHMVAAAGAVEFMSCLGAIRDSIIPPTINLNEPDPECDLDYVPREARKHSVKTAISNSFGFGGQNICLTVEKYES